MAETKNRGKWQLYLMLAIVFGTLVAGYVIFPKTPEQRSALLTTLGTTNHGQLLVSPADIGALPLTTMENQPWIFSEQKLKWRMLIIGDARCSDECSELLFTTRQVHLRLSKNAQRFERIYLTTASELDQHLTETIEKEHPYLKVLKTNPAAMDNWLKKIATRSESIALLTDQNGQAMMLYNSGHDGGGMLEDINHLLKYSPAQ